MGHRTQHFLIEVYVFSMKLSTYSKEDTYTPQAPDLLSHLQLHTLLLKSLTFFVPLPRSFQFFFAQL